MHLNNPEVRIETTNRCNSYCICCPRESMTRAKTQMGFDNFKSIVDEAKQLGAQWISPFGFGEPMLDPSIVDKINYCTSQNLATFITTNGSLIGMGRGKELIDAGLIHARFSIHGTTKHSYEAVHRSLNYETTMANFTNFYKMAQDYSRPVLVSVTSMVFLDELGAIVNFFRDKCDHLEVWRPHNWCNAKSYRVIKKDKIRKRTCGRAISGPIQIQADGTVIPCCFLTDSELVLGNVFNDSLENIIMGEKYGKFREAHDPAKSHQLLKNYPCDDCDQLNIGDNPLLYSTRDVRLIEGKTSSLKFAL